MSFLRNTVAVFLITMWLLFFLDPAGIGEQIAAVVNGYTGAVE